MGPRPAEPTFDLGRGWWIAGGVVSLLAGVGSIVRALPRDPTPAALTGVFIGGVTGTFLTAMLIAWIAWRLAGRSCRAGRVAFVVMLVLPLLSRVAAISERAIAHETVQDVLDAHTRFVAELESARGRPTAPDGVAAAVAPLDARFDPVEARTYADGVVLVRAVRAHHRALAMHTLDYFATERAAANAGLSDFLGARSPAVRARSRAAMQAVLDAVARLRWFLDTQVETLRASLADVEGYDALIDPLVKGVTHSQADKARIVAELDAHRDCATHLLAMYDLLDARNGQWRVAVGGKVHFARAEDTAQFATYDDALGQAVAQLARAKGIKLTIPP